MRSLQRFSLLGKLFVLLLMFVMVLPVLPMQTAEANGGFSLGLGFGGGRQRVVTRQRIVQQRVVVPRRQVVVQRQQVYAQPFVVQPQAVYVQPFVAPYSYQQNFQFRQGFSGCGGQGLGFSY